MATAMDNKHTIPCERCNTQIDLEEWSDHLRHCTRPEKSSSRTTQRDDMEETIAEGIPCEYCHVQIELNDFESHSKQCADSHNHRIQKLRNGFDDEPTITDIPCEYCNQLIRIHDLEWHSQQCDHNNNGGADHIDNDYIGELMGPSIPCEYCGVQVSIDDYTRHIIQCTDAERKRIEELVKRNERDENNHLIPCEYCDKSFSLHLLQDHQNQCRMMLYESAQQSNGLAGAIFGGVFRIPDNWDQSAVANLSVHTLKPSTEEYNVVSKRFGETLPSNQIVKIERIQNRRWYRQYDAHRDDFIERYGNSTEQWLFHGCKSESTQAIMNDCFNRSHAVRCAVGQGIYFATQASTSLGYTQPDTSNQRHMFLARVLVGKTTRGDQTTRVCPPGFDTTGGGAVFVTYHDAQAYAEYLITFR